MLAHSKEPCDGLGTDRHADTIEPKCLGNVKLVHQRGAKLLAHNGGGPGVDQRLALGQGVRAEPLGFEHLWALQEPLGIASKALDEVFALWQLVHASA